MKPLLIAAFAGAMLLSALPAAAGWHPHDPGVDARQRHQHQRIVHGLRSGELTRHEARRLLREQRRIRHKEHWYRSDGVLTQAERHDLQHELNRASRDIYNQKHDAQRRF